MAASVEEKERQKAIGARITQARHECGGMSQEELAMLIGVSVRSIQAYESGDVVPYRFMRQLENVLDKPMAWFLHGDVAVRAQDDQLTAIREELAALRSAFERLVEKLA